MKAISLHQPWASMIAQGTKTIETRFWPTKHRGDLLIVSTLKPEIKGFLCGHALCIVNLVNCRKMIASDAAAARCPWCVDLYSWVLMDIRKVEPFEVKGRQGFYEVDYEIEAELMECPECPWEGPVTECENDPPGQLRCPVCSTIVKEKNPHIFRVR